MLKCNICDKECPSFKSLSAHLKSHKLSSKDYYDIYLKKEDEGICRVCGKQTEFCSIVKGYNFTCSKECYLKDYERYETVKRNNLANYGVENVFQLESVKQKSRQTCKNNYGVESPLQSKEILDKVKKTCEKRYGVDNPAKSEIVKEKAKSTFIRNYGVDNPAKSKIVREKTENTNLNRYGVKCVFSSLEIREKSKKTMMLRYNVETCVHSEEIWNKMCNTNFERYGAKTPFHSIEIREKALKSKLENIQRFKEDNNYISLKDVTKLYGNGWRFNEELNIMIINYKGYQYISALDLPKIAKYHEKHKFKSKLEDDVFEFLSNNLKNDIIRRSRKVIPPKELDLYIPELNFAIECNGVWIHSENHGMSKSYHVEKLNDCNNKNIKLLHLYEWEWYNKKHICESIILSALGIYKNIIYARKCEIKEVSSEESIQFLDHNHLQGSINSSYRLGLYYKNELVQLIALGKSRFKNGEIELLRMCTKLNTKVVGGFSKLMKYQPFDEIISYIDRSKFNGNSYFKTDWQFVSYTPPNYNYYKGNLKLSRQSCQKHKLPKLLGDNFDPNLTETENMMKNGYLKVYDSGNIKVKWRRN